MTKSELVEKMASELEGVSRREAAETVEWLFMTLMKALKEDNRVVYSGFGSFTVNTTKARMGRNPRTGEAVQIPSRKNIKFNPSPKLKDFLNSEES